MRFKNIINNYKLCTVVLVDRIATGAEVSISNYIAYKNKNDIQTILIKPESKKSIIKMIVAFIYSKSVIINGLRTFVNPTVILFALLKKGIFIYLHETSWAFENNYINKYKIRTYFLKKILKKQQILCVSKKQEEYIQNHFSAYNTQVIYECIKTIDDVEMSPEHINILMVASLQRRKGVDSFSKLADYAKEKENWQFYWIGEKIEDNLYLSPNVNWVGYRNDVATYLKKCNVFFLSSIDDPFPITCLEALYNLKKCVVYENVGTAEIISDIKGCAVYNEYDIESMYKAIEKVLSEDLDLDKVYEIYVKISSVEAFSSRLDNILEPHPDS